MVTTVGINTDRGVVIHQLSTINEWIPICAHDEQHKKWLFKGLLIRKVKEAAAKSQGPSFPPRSQNSVGHDRHVLARTSTVNQSLRRGRGNKSKMKMGHMHAPAHTKYTHAG